jgi:DNA gyrase inhibitor GyrI
MNLPKTITREEAEELILIGYREKYGVLPESVYIYTEVKWCDPDSSEGPEVTMDICLTLPQ